jgi:hypothetical protein
VGSTTQPLYKRLYEHKKDYKLFLKGKKNYISSFEIIKLDDDVYIELVCNCPCNSKNELEKEEGQYIRKIKCVNKNLTKCFEWNEESHTQVKKDICGWFYNSFEYIDDTKEVLSLKVLYDEFKSTEFHTKYKEKNNNKNLAYHNFMDYLTEELGYKTNKLFYKMIDSRKIIQIKYKKKSLSNVLIRFRRL